MSQIDYESIAVAITKKTGRYTTIEDVKKHYWIIHHHKYMEAFHC